MTLEELMARLSKIDPASYSKLDANDQCWHIGEYTAHASHTHGETNNQILNLKKRPPVPPNQVRWKNRAISYWGDKLAEVLNLDFVAERATLVPVPCSKPRGHQNYDDRMARVLQHLARHRAGLDIREVIVTKCERPAQHEGERLSTDELLTSMEVDRSQLGVPLRPITIVVDDVFTQGGTFRAMKRLLQSLPNVQSVGGIFLAKTVWNPFFEADEF